jgi:hypothetical protein
MPQFKKNALLEMLDGDAETLVKVSDMLTGKSRWSINHELVFKEAATGRFFCAHYSEGATEQQDESPFEYEPDDVEVTEVFPVERTVTFYATKKPAPVESP